MHACPVEMGRSYAQTAKPTSRTLCNVHSIVSGRARYRNQPATDLLSMVVTMRNRGQPIRPTPPEPGIGMIIKNGVMRLQAVARLPLLCLSGCRRGLRQAAATPPAAQSSGHS